MMYTDDTQQYITVKPDATEQASGKLHHCIDNIQQRVLHKQA